MSTTTRQKREQVRQTIPLIFAFVVLITDFACVFLFSALDASFDLNVLKTGSFWANYALTSILIFVAYFSMIFLGNFYGNGSDEILLVQDKLSEAQSEINELLLAGELEKFTNTLNVIERCKAIIDRMDRKLKRTKNDIKRTKIINIKNAAIYSIQIEEAKILERKLLETKVKEYNDYIENLNFNHRNYRFLKYRKIDKRIIMSSKRGSSRKVGKFSAGSIIASESILKISMSLLGTFILTALVYGTFNWNAANWFNILWRIMLIGSNAFMGYSLGYTMVVGDKRAALNERLDVFSVFKAYGFKSHLIIEKTVPKTDIVFKA